MKALSDAQKALESEPASPALEARFLAQAETLIATGTAPYGPGVAGEAHTGVVPGRFHVCLEDWVLSIVMDNPDRGIFDRSKPAFITPLDIDARPVLTAPIDLPSGDLLIADWIRIAAFTRAVDSSDCQINFASERMRRTLRGIRTHNLIEVSCGNTCPSILPDGDGIRFAAINHDEETDLPLFPEEEILGMVITDYWAITAIDIVDLRAILATADPEADPDALIDAWLQGQWGHCVTRVRLAPGRWYASFVDDRITPEVSCLEEAGLPGPGGIETVLALSREAPTLDPALSRAV